jgi:hypothetical protein
VLGPSPRLIYSLKEHFPRYWLDLAQRKAIITRTTHYPLPIFLSPQNNKQTTNNLETARWIASLRDSASPWMKYEFITFCPQHEYGVLTVEEQQVLAQNAAKKTRLMTVKAQLRRSKQR